MDNRTIRCTWAYARGLLLVVALALLLVPMICRAESPSPILLLYGFQPIPGFYALQLWYEFAEHWSGRARDNALRISLDEQHTLYSYVRVDAAHRDVFIGDYGLPLEPTVRDLRFYAARVKEEIRVIRERLDVPCVTIVGHSMGGLIARCYIEASDFSSVIGTPGFSDFRTTYQGDVDVLITLATPHHGTETAALGPRWAYGALSRQLEPDSLLLRLLNSVGESGSALHSNVRYVSLAGQSCFGCGVRRDEASCLAECVADGLAWTGSDLVILMQSAYVPGAENVACIGFDHVDMHTHQALIEAIEAILAGKPTPSAVFSAPDLRRLGDSLPPRPTSVP